MLFLKKLFKAKDMLHLSESFEARKISADGKSHVRYRKNSDMFDHNYSKRFIEYADIDYEAALVLFSIQDRQYDFMNQGAFFCAQSTEKYLKAYLFYKSSEIYPGSSAEEVLHKKFKKLSHNLEKALNECANTNKRFSQFKEKVSAINRFSLLKYPDEEDKYIYSEDGLRIESEMLNDVKKIGDFVKDLITN